MNKKLRNNIVVKDNILLNHLLANGIKNDRAVDLVTTYPRNLFLPEDYASMGNSDGAVFYKKNKFIIEISTIAMMLMLFNKKQVEKSLVVGSGLGYGAVLLSNFSNGVIGIENDSDVIEKAKSNALSLKINNIDFVLDDLFLPKIEDEFDLILVEGAFLDVSDKWIKLLKNNGILLGIKRDRNISKIVKITKVDDEIVQTIHATVPTPYLEGVPRKEKFVF